MPDPRPLHPPPHPKPHGGPPHLRVKSRARRVVLAFVISTLVALGIGYILYYFEISINVILPVLAPIWVGVATISYMAMSER